MKQACQLMQYESSYLNWNLFLILLSSYYWRIARRLQQQEQSIHCVWCFYCSRIDDDWCEVFNHGITKQLHPSWPRRILHTQTPNHHRLSWRIVIRLPFRPIASFWRPILTAMTTLMITERRCCLRPWTNCLPPTPTSITSSRHHDHCIPAWCAHRRHAHSRSINHHQHNSCCPSPTIHTATM